MKMTVGHLKQIEQLGEVVDLPPIMWVNGKVLREWGAETDSQGNPIHDNEAYIITEGCIELWQS